MNVPTCPTTRASGIWRWSSRKSISYCATGACSCPMIEDLVFNRNISRRHSIYLYGRHSVFVHYGEWSEVEKYVVLIILTLKVNKRKNLPELIKILVDWMDWLLLIQRLQYQVLIAGFPGVRIGRFVQYKSYGTWNSVWVLFLSQDAAVDDLFISVPLQSAR